jgi:hypothetical protein
LAAATHLLIGTPEDIFIRANIRSFAHSNRESHGAGAMWMKTLLEGYAHCIYSLELRSSREILTYTR